MSLPAPRTIDALGVAHVQWLEHPLQAIVVCGDGNQMNVVAHEAIGQYFNLELLAVLPQPGQICLPVFRSKKNVFTPIATLRDVVGDTGKNCSG